MLNYFSNVPLAAPSPPPPTLTWLEKLKVTWKQSKQWVNTNVTQPAKETVNKAVTTAKKFVTTTVTTVKETYQDVKNDVKQKWIDVKQWVDTKVVQSARDTMKNLLIVLATKADDALDRIYDYNGPVILPKEVDEELMLALPGVSTSTPENYIFNNYYVNQQPMIGQQRWLSPNECVTAATIQEMNMMQDILTSKFGIPQLAHMDLLTFATAFDMQGPLVSILRPPADIPIIGGMLPPPQAKKILNFHGDWLRDNYGHGYTAELTWGNTVDDLIENLNNGYPTSIHISQPTNLLNIKNGKVEWGDWRTLIGGAPHTVTLAGYDPNTDTWLILDPSPYANTDYTKWNTDELMDLWGRQFIGYPPRFAMTTLIPDTTSTLKASVSTPSEILGVPSPTSVESPTPSQTAQPSSQNTTTPLRP